MNDMSSVASTIVDGDAPMAIELVKGLAIERARDIIRQTKSVDEIRGILDKAKALGMYMRSRNAAKEAQRDALEIRVRAERRIGELADELGLSAAKIGVKQHEFPRCRDLADIPADIFEQIVADCRSWDEVFTIGDPVRLWKRREDADNLGPKATDDLKRAFLAGEIDEMVAKFVATKPAWRQVELVRDTESADSAYWEARDKARLARDKADPSGAVARFAETAKEVTSRADYLINLGLLTPTLSRQIKTAVDAANRHVRMNMKAKT